MIEILLSTQVLPRMLWSNRPLQKFASMLLLFTSFNLVPKAQCDVPAEEKCNQELFRSGAIRTHLEENFHFLQFQDACNKL